MSERRRVSSGAPWEAVAGYSRAIAVGDSCWVAGTTDAGPDGVSRHPGDAGAQTRAVHARPLATWPTAANWEAPPKTMMLIAIASTGENPASRADRPKTKPNPSAETAIPAESASSRLRQA